MVCKIIDECRCYAYKDNVNPMTNQFCAARRGAGLSRCTADCCAGGCPGQVEGVGTRQPFRIIERPATDVVADLRIPILILIAVAQLLVIIL